jgi:hypothetical protein
MGKEWLRGTEEDTRPDPAHRRGGWCGVETGRRELTLGDYGEEKQTPRGLIERKTKRWGGGSSAGDSTQRQRENRAWHPSS